MGHRAEASKILKGAMDASWDLVQQQDLDSIERGVRLFLRATKKVPPHFAMCPGDMTGCCQMPTKTNN